MAKTTTTDEAKPVDEAKPAKGKKAPRPAIAHTVTQYHNSGHHTNCPGAFYNGPPLSDESDERQLMVCSHEYHDANPACWVCKSTDSELDPARRQCIDAEGCAETVAHNLVNNAKYQEYLGHRAAGEAAKAAKRAAAELDEDGEPRAPRVKAERPTTGTCHHCGEPTKGGKFVAGHDAKLKGILIQGGKDGDAEAVAEAMARDWYKPGRFPELESAADAILQNEPTHEFIARRVAERIAAVEAAA